MSIYTKVIFLIVTIPVSFNTTWCQSKESVVEHSTSCPKSCKPCEAALDKGLTFIVSGQKDDGSWSDKLAYDMQQRNADRLHKLAFTSFCGLALCTHLKYEKEIQRAVDYIQKALPKFIEAGTQPGDMRNVQIADVLIFLCHVYHKKESQDIKSLIEKGRDLLVENHGKDGSWTYSKETGSMPFVTTNVLFSLALAHSVGIKVPDKVFDHVRKFYLDFQSKEGDFSYHRSALENGLSYPAYSTVGRTAAALGAMKLLGLAETSNFTKAKEFVEKNLTDIDRSYHGPSYHVFWSSLAFVYLEDKSLWKKFWEHYRDVIMSSQASDGSIMLKPQKQAYRPVDGTFVGPVTTTALYSIVFQLQNGNFLFAKLQLNTKEKKQ